MDIVNIMDSHQLRRAKPRQGCVLCAAKANSAAENRGAPGLPLHIH